MSEVIVACEVLLTLVRNTDSNLLIQKENCKHTHKQYISGCQLNIMS